MSLIRIILAVCIIFVLLLIFLVFFTKISFRQTIDRNIKFIRLFWSIVNLWRNKKFLINLSEIDQKSVDELNREDATLEREYLSSASNRDRSLCECFANIDIDGKNMLNLYKYWWKTCITTRTRRLLE